MKQARVHPGGLFDWLVEQVKEIYWRPLVAAEAEVEALRAERADLWQAAVTFADAVACWADDPPDGIDQEALEFLKREVTARDASHD